MDKVAQMDRSDRADLFNETAALMGLHPVIVEKDFWVCWILKQLFTITEFSDRLVFKGGTSLSKCFNLIQRFSEDIDIAVNFEKLGFSDRKDPRQEELSYTKRAILLNEMLQTCRSYIADELFPVLNARIQEILLENDWQLQIDSADGNIVGFSYPASLETGLDYIRPRIILELGTHAEPVPNENYDIQPYAAEYFPKLFCSPSVPLPRWLPDEHSGKRQPSFMPSTIDLLINLCLCVIPDIMPMSLRWEKPKLLMKLYRIWICSKR